MSKELQAAAEKLYDAEVMSVDHALSELFSELDQRAFLKNALVVVTADHGEEFWDHGLRGHSHSLYGELIHVPLLIHVPGKTERVDVLEAVSLLDVAPTLLDWIGGTSLEFLEGRSLKPIISNRSTSGIGRWLRPRRASSEDRRPVFSELIQDGAFPRHTPHERAVIIGPRKLILGVGGEKEFFDEASDPHEQQQANLSNAEKRELEQTLATFVRQTAEHSPGQVEPMDEETLNELRALGYVY